MALTGSDPAPLNLNGHTNVPAGKIAAVVTYLEMTEPSGATIEDMPGDVALEQVDHPDPDAYRALFRRIGTDWLWFSRLLLTDSALTELLQVPTTEYSVLRQAGNDVGMLELDFSDPENVYLAFFGLVPEATGSGLGRWLMRKAIDRAFQGPARRFWLHTCTLDHPAALRFYVGSGFTPYRRTIEVVDDPRLAGVLPETAQAWNPPIR